MASQVSEEEAGSFFGSGSSCGAGRRQRGGSQHCSGGSGDEGLAGPYGQGGGFSFRAGDRQVDAGLCFRSGWKSWVSPTCSCSGWCGLGTVPVRFCRVCGGCRRGGSRRIWCSASKWGDGWHGGECCGAWPSGGSTRGHDSAALSRHDIAGAEHKAEQEGRGGEEAQSKGQLCGPNSKELFSPPRI